MRWRYKTNDDIDKNVLQLFLHVVLQYLTVHFVQNVVEMVRIIGVASHGLWKELNVRNGR